MKKRLLIAALAALMALPAMAQEDAMKAFPGYVDFGELSDLFGEPSVQIAVGESLLNLVASIGAYQDPEAAEMFRRLHGVRVNVFETGEYSDDQVQYVRDVSSALRDRGWESVVSVNQDDEQVRIYMKINGDEVEGITVMALDQTEAAFINVIGDIDPAELQRVMDNFDIEYGNDDDADDAGDGA